MPNYADGDDAIQDYDEAIKWYTEVLDLELRMDGSMGGDYRFVTVGVKDQPDVSIVLHKLEDAPPATAGSIHGLLFHADDCRKDVERLRRGGVTITLVPEDQPWGVQAVFQDLYGNTHVLVQPDQSFGD